MAQATSVSARHDMCWAILGPHSTAATAMAVAAMLPEIHPDAADLGDIGLIAAEGPLGQALCVVDASGLIVLTETGHGRRPRGDMLRAFKVG